MFPLFMTARNGGSNWASFDNVSGGSDSILDKSIYKKKLGDKISIINYCATDHKQILTIMYTVDKLYTSSRTKSPLLSKFSPKLKTSSIQQPLITTNESHILNTQLTRLVQLMEIHLSCSCSVLQPAMRRYVSEKNGGIKWSVAIGKEYHLLTQLMNDVRHNHSLTSHSSNTMKLWKKLFDRIERHCNECENITLDWLYRCCTAEQLINLGQQYITIKQTSTIPSSPTYNTTESSMSRIDSTFQLG